MTLKPEQMKAVASAKKTLMEGQLTLWNLRLEAAVAAGDGTLLLDRLGASVEDTINNCGCNVQCGAAMEGVGGLAVNPVRG